MQRHFYFDLRDGITKRDKMGVQFSNVTEAIEHSKSLAKSERMQRPSGHKDLVVSVIDDAGVRVHSELVYPLAE